MAYWSDEPLSAGVYMIDEERDEIVALRTNRTDRPDRFVWTLSYFLFTKTPIPYLPLAVCEFRNDRVQVVWLSRDRSVNAIPLEFVIPWRAP